jgi:putative membrane-bound dehydrogenase-like protein
MNAARWSLTLLFACLTRVAPAAPSPAYLQIPAGWIDGAESRDTLPLPDDLAKAEVVLLSGSAAWTAGEKLRMEAYVEAGGGVVLVHGAIAASGWVKGGPSAWDGPVPLFFTPPGHAHPLSRGISNFDIVDEMIHGFEVDPAAAVLATTWSPNRKHLKGSDPQPYVYGVSPVMWTKERGKGRVVCFVPGKNAGTFKHPAIRTMLRRSLAWAAGKAEVDGQSSPEDLVALTYPPGGPLSPEQSLAGLQVHPEFAVERVAEEPLISKPLNLDWDGAGRLWVVESVEYPEGRAGGGPESMPPLWQRETSLEKPAPVGRPGRDKVSWLEDTDGDGRADQRETLYTGLGTGDTHAVLNNLRWGLDGWVYATHGYSGSPRVTSGDGTKDFGAVGSGVVRFRPDGSAIEMVSAKGGNCWGVDITAEGELFFTQPTSGDLVMHVPVSDRRMAEGGLGREPSWQVMVHLRPVKPLMSWEEIVENQPNDVIGSFTAACGCAVYEGGAWPEEWNLGYFTCEPTVHIVHHEALTPAGVTFAAEKTREEEFSATRDFWSRPIDTRVGPDGQLYVIDFYNQAILHNDPRGPIHLWHNQAARPDRDHFFGRIHRYRHRQSKLLPKAELATLDGQVAALGHPNREVRFRAQRLIEEGDVKAAAAKLSDANGAAKIHALWIRAAAEMLPEEELIAAMADADPGVRVTAGRVLDAHPRLATAAVVSALAARLPGEEDPRVRLQWLAGLPAGAVVPADVLVAIPADDRWTLAAVARLAKNDAAGVLAAALALPDAAKQAPLVGLLFDARKNDAGPLAAMLEALETAQGRGTEMAVSSLSLLHRSSLPRGARLDETLVRLASSGDPGVRAAALPLAAGTWSSEHRGEKLPGMVADLLQAAPGDARVLSSLAALPLYPAGLPAALRDGIGKSPGMLDAVVSNGSPDAAALLVSLLPSLPAPEKAKVLESLLGKPSSAIALVDALDRGEVTLAVAGTTVLPRLADHPEAAVRDRAAPLMAKLRGASEAKDAIIARLLPEVSKPGNAETGRQLYAACAACHKYRDEGALIGPVLEGMGVHGIETLLTHIIDPNREVEPSYLVWNLATTDGRTVSGFISRETDGSIFVKNAAGEIEVPRASIASRANTGKSLMPEGFEGIGTESLRDLVTYLRAGEQRFHTIPFGKAATADGSRGVYLSPENVADRVSLKRHGLVEERGVPFHLPDPLTAPGGKNVTVLKGGMDERALSRTMPQRVEIPVNLAAGRLHLLGAVAGWGFPAVTDKDPLVTIAVHYAGDGVEELVFRNGVDFADHIRRVDVPGSAWTDLTEQGQLRYLWRDLKKADAVIEKLVIESAGKIPAPMIAAITLESPGSAGAMAPAPDEGGPADQETALLPVTSDRLRVLLAGGGSSHDFRAWYDREDQTILREAGMMTAYTEDPAQAADQLPRADVLLFSSNDPAYPASGAFRKAFEAFARRGGGLVLLHPATWYNWPGWPAYNSTFVGGGSRAHDPLGEFGLAVIRPEHPVVGGLQREFRLRDEHYQITLDPAAKVEVLVETTVSGQTGKKHAAVWIVDHPASRIVGIAPGHDGAARREPNFRRLLANAARWAGRK